MPESWNSGSILSNCRLGFFGARSLAGSVKHNCSASPVFALNELLVLALEFELANTPVPFLVCTVE